MIKINQWRSRIFHKDSRYYELRLCQDLSDDVRHDSENQLASLLGRVGAVLAANKIGADIKPEDNYEINYIK